MLNIAKKFPLHVEGLHKHDTKQSVLLRFLFIVGILAVYFLFLTLKYDIATGGTAAFLTWSFFVLCTPIADAGLLLDFPMRLFLRVRMVVSELFVWVAAIGLNVFMMTTSPATYETTFLTRVLHKILMTPWPYWLIVVLSAVGTFLSVLFADELLDVLRHKDRKHFHRFKFWFVAISFALVLLFVFMLYEYLVQELGVVQVM